jgi:hypothetical protein
MGQDLFVVWFSLHASVCQRQKVFAKQHCQASLLSLFTPEE